MHPRKQIGACEKCGLPFEECDCEELVKREWKRCKDCEHREIKIGTDNKNHSFCMFWDNFLYRIEWCNK